jgi:hypothetical protein
MGTLPEQKRPGSRPKPCTRRRQSVTFARPASAAPPGRSADFPK